MKNVSRFPFSLISTVCGVSFNSASKLFLISSARYPLYFPGGESPSTHEHGTSRPAEEKMVGLVLLSELIPL